MVNIKASEQKLNGKSSTEAEVIGASMSHVSSPCDIVTVFCGSTRIEDVFYQDYQGAMKMEKNGRN